MKSRRIIASFFFVVYVWAAIGALCSSLTCSCAAVHGRDALCTRHAQEASCARHLRENSCALPESPCTCASCEAHAQPQAQDQAQPQAPTTAGTAYSAPCCNHLHALYETLYTRCCDGERCRQHLSYKLLSYKLLAEKLFAAGLADPAAWRPEAPEPTPVHCDRTIPPLRRGYSRLAGLRAPPVTA